MSDFSVPDSICSDGAVSESSSAPIYWEGTIEVEGDVVTLDRNVRGLELMKAVFHMIKLIGQGNNVKASYFAVRHRVRDYSVIRIAVLMNSAHSMARVQSMLVTMFSGIVNLSCVVTASMYAFMTVISTAIETDDDYEDDEDEDDEDGDDESEDDEDGDDESEDDEEPDPSLEDDADDALRCVMFYNSATVPSDQSDDSVADTCDSSATGYARPYPACAKVRIVNYNDIK
jgi:hypothetical protein